jgi:hypothetical protein
LSTRNSVWDKATHPEEPMADGDRRKQTMDGCNDYNQDLAVSGGGAATTHIATLDDREEGLGERGLCRILVLFPQRLDEIRSVEKQERFRHIDGDCALLTPLAIFRDGELTCKDRCRSLLRSSGLSRMAASESMYIDGRARRADRHRRGYGMFFSKSDLRVSVALWHGSQFCVQITNS